MRLIATIVLTLLGICFLTTSVSAQTCNGNSCNVTVNVAVPPQVATAPAPSPYPTGYVTPGYCRGMPIGTYGYVKTPRLGRFGLGRPRCSGGCS